VGQDLCDIFATEWNGDLLKTLRYVYQHQGYGTLEDIPALYGFVWVTPDVMRGAVWNQLFGNPPLVWCFQKGWGPFWTNLYDILRKKNVKFNFGTTISKIQRGGKVVVDYVCSDPNVIHPDDQVDPSDLTFSTSTIH